eukprot:7611856-Ditylum_brightwellii.AAC.1
MIGSFSPDVGVGRPCSTHTAKRQSAHSGAAGSPLGGLDANATANHNPKLPSKLAQHYMQKKAELMRHVQ